MTEHLYYNDSKLLSFEAKITETGLLKDKSYIVLDQSAFYPTSGGQQHDIGTLDGVNVIDVKEREDGAVVHFLDKLTGSIGDIIKGEVDSVRRLNHCQSHTAQHILSAVAFKSFNLKTVSVHLGAEYSAIEFEASSITEADISSLEVKANDAIQDNLPIEIIFAEGEELSKIQLRRETKRTGKIRVIHITGLDYAACGGTHCEFTSEVRVIKIIALEKIRGRLLIKFLSGQQAIDDYINRYLVTDKLSRSLTCNPNDLFEKVQKLNEEKKEIIQRLSESQRELIPIWIANLSTKQVKAGSHTIVVDSVHTAEIAIGPQLASKLANEIGGIALLLIKGRLFLAVADSITIKAGELASGLVKQNNLKGGGSDKAAQLGGATLDKMEIYKESLKGLLSDS